MHAQNINTRQGGTGRYLLCSALFLLALALLGIIFQRPLAEGFNANSYLNATILGIFGLGVAYTLKALIDVLGDARAALWAADLVAAARRGERPVQQVTEVLLTSTRRGLNDFLGTVYRVVHHGSTAATLPYLLDSLAVRHENRRALVRYLTGALVLLGLIGTFYGLLITIAGVREVITSLSATPSTDTMALLTGLKERLATPLSGMGIAFSSSLFGLLASLALAFLELQLFHAQNDTHARLEALVVSDLVPLWQQPITPVVGTTGEPTASRYLLALLQATVERLDMVAAIMESAAGRHDGTGRIAEHIASLGERIESLRETLDGVERDRTADLRHELRVIARTLAQRDLSHAS